jgi:DnaJ family protein C protein 13
MLTRLGLCSKDEQLTPYVDFKVQKFSPRNEDPVRRLICLSETCFIERDPGSYSVICARALKTVRAFSQCFSFSKHSMTIAFRLSALFET